MSHMKSPARADAQVPQRQPPGDLRGPAEPRGETADDRNPA